ncbi:MAG: ABC transporter permease [Desulfofustis sp.]|jgi:phospholipid/cholesterol/gamma-HCH transport system permease protein
MARPGELSFGQPVEDTLAVKMSGSWKLHKDLPSVEAVSRQIEKSPAVQKLHIDARDVDEWDSGLLIFLGRSLELATRRDLELQTIGLPEGATKLLQLAVAVPEKKDARKASPDKTFLVHLGDETVDFFQGCGDLLDFVGDATMAFVKLLRGKAQYRRSDLGLVLESCSGQALPIVTLISFLVGIILAFVGLIQLKFFGAEIFIADLVGIAMFRVMAAIMTGIVMAGRTGGAFAAQLGTMQVNQEIDALKTLGISPMEFLVLPRMLGLTLMMPLLALYANVVGVIGGAVVALGEPNISLIQYYQRTVTAVSLWDLGIGLFSSIVFGIIVALAGCMRGMQCGGSASAVGDAATAAVVTAIVGIIVSTAVITLITSIIGV